MLKRIFLALVLLVAPQACLLAQVTIPTVLISEVLYNEPGSDTGGEFVELYNYGDTALDLSGWLIGDEETKGQSGGAFESMYRFPAGASIASGRTLLIARSASTIQTTFGVSADFEMAVGGDDPGVPNLVQAIDWDPDGGAMTLNNEGDQVLLLDPAETLVDGISWGTEGVFLPGFDSPSLNGDAEADGQSWFRLDPRVDQNTVAEWALGDPSSPAGIAPIITLLGDNPFLIEAGPSGYSDPGATASDDLDGDLSGSIVVDASAVNRLVPGEYTVTFNVTDSSGNNAQEVVRTVQVVDSTAPLLILFGSNPITLQRGSVYNEPGASASDGVDGDLTSEIVIDASDVVTTAVGSYQVTYNVMDSSGNASPQQIRTVNVIDTIGPSLVSLSPADDSVNVPVGADLVATFNEDIGGFGRVIIQNDTDAIQVANLRVADTSQVAITGKEIRINLSADLEAGKLYTVRFMFGGVRDLEGNQYGGLFDPTAWNFATESPMIPLVNLLADDVDVVSDVASRIQVGSVPGLEAFAWAVTTDTTFTSDKTYILTETLFVTNGAKLTIEAGTRIYATGYENGPGSEDNVYGSIVVTRGAEICVNGAKADPVLMTTVDALEAERGNDIDGDGSIAPAPTADTTGRWGGLAILGEAIVAYTDGSGGNRFVSSIQGLAPANSNDADMNGLADITQYGTHANSDGPTLLGNNARSSGELHYLSIRHGGMAQRDGRLNSGLTLAAVGFGTTVSHVEVASGAGDGVEILGGTVSTDHLSVAFVEDDSFDIDEGHAVDGAQNRGGIHQFWFSIADSSSGDHALELDGVAGDTLGTGLGNSQPLILNGTFLDAGASPSTEAIRFDDFFAGVFLNNAVGDFGVQFDNQPDGDGGLLLLGNVFEGSNDGGAITSGFSTNNAFNQPLGLTSVSGLPDGMLDPRLAAGSFLFDFNNEEFDETFLVGFSDGVEVVNYSGAFGTTDLWIDCWTFLAEEGYLPMDTDNPVLVAQIPAVGATVPTNTDLRLTFNEVVTEGSGSITLFDVSGSGGNTVIDSTSGLVDVVGSQVTVDLDGLLQPGTVYNILVDAGAFEDLDGNGTSEILFPFSTALDAVPPLLVSLSPADDATQVPPNTILVATFDEPISIVPGGGTITLKNLTDVTEMGISVTDSTQVFSVGASLIVDPIGNLDPEATYAVRIDASSIQDTAGNDFAGINDDTIWNFTTSNSLDVTPPEIEFQSPPDFALIPPDSELVVRFDEDVIKGGGLISVFSVFAGTSINIPVGSSRVTVDGDLVRIDLSGLLEFSEFIDVFVPSGAFRDLAGNPAPQFFWTIQTITPLPGPPTLTSGDIFDDQGGGGVIIPGGRPIQFFLAFSEAMDLSTITTSDFENAGTAPVTISEVFSLAEFGSPGEIGVTVIPGGAGTLQLQVKAGAVLADYNGGVLDTSAPIPDFDVFTVAPGPFLVSTTPPRDAVEVPAQSLIELKFNEDVEKGSGTISLTGYATDSGSLVDSRVVNVSSGGVLADGVNVVILLEGALIPGLDYGVAIGQGTFRNLSGTIFYGDVFYFRTDSSVPGPPTLDPSDIVDDGGGGTILEGRTVTYTVTFSEAMEAATISAGDFDNGGTAPVTIVNVMSTRDDNIFQVEVKPEGAGSLVLQVAAGAILEDLDGELLDTTVPIADDTVITVLSDPTPPTLADIMDDQGGNDVLPFFSVFYTVSFSEKLDEATIDASDFSNAGTATVNIGEPFEIGDGVYFFQVTPLSEGTIELQIPAGSVITDLAGNPLDTSTALIDDTTIFVIDRPELIAVQPNFQVPLDAEFVLEFDEPVFEGVGSIYLEGLNFGDILEFDVDSEYVDIDGALVTISPMRNLLPEETYFLDIPEATFADTDGNDFLGDSFFITTGLSATGPPFLRSADIVDDVGGGPVLDGDLVVYTITFSEAMDFSTIGVTDFENAAAATITVESVEETAVPSIFEVSVIAEEMGDLQIQVKSGAVLADVTGEFLDTTGPIADDTTIRVESLDAPPVLTNLSPADEAMGVAVDQNLVATFSEIIIEEAGSIFLKNLTDGTQREIDVADEAEVTIGGNMLTIDPSPELEFGKRYAVRIEAGVVRDAGGNDFGGILNDAVWNFTTEVMPDLDAPVIIGLSPGDGSTGVPLDTHLDIFFDEPVAKGTGGFLIRPFGSGTPVYSFEVSSGFVTVADTAVRIDLPGDLGPDTIYLVEIDPGAFEDLAGNGFAGIGPGLSPWSFRTLIPDVTPPVLAGTDIVDDRSGSPVEVGLPVTYTVTFSEAMNASTISTTDFENAGSAAVVINSVSPIGVAGAFEVAVSTAGAGSLQLQVKAGAHLEDDAGNALETASPIADDTVITVSDDLTAPSVVSLSPANGAVVAPDNPLIIEFDEEVRKGAGTITLVDLFLPATPVVLDVSSPSVTISEDEVSIDLTGVLVVNTLYSVVVSAGAFEDLAGNDAAEISWTFTTAEFADGPPELSGSDFVDDKGGGPVVEEELVTYTVTFSETMDQTTVSAADFENAGTAPVTIESFTTTFGQVFEVRLRPIGAGTLQLQVRNGASLLDLDGEALDTLGGIPDDTIILVDPLPTLASLSPSTGILSPSFDPEIDLYTMTVDHEVSGLTISATPGEVGATLTVNSVPVAAGLLSGVISLQPGANVINVEVTSAGGSASKTYQLMVTRLAEGSGADRGLTYGIDPRGSFFQGATFSPLILDLNALGISEGATIRLTKSGSFDNGSGAQFSGLSGVFSSSDVLLDSSNLERVEGAIVSELGTGSITAADIPEDFSIGGGASPAPGPLTVAVPTGATHLFLGVSDPSPSDNTDPDGDFKIGVEKLTAGPFPLFTSQPEPFQTATLGETVDLVVTASGVPAPTYQWYRGTSGNTTSPIGGATSPNFTTPALDETSNYWVRVSNLFGSIDSRTINIDVFDPTNADLGGLAASVSFSPGFNPLTLNYTANVSTLVTGMTVTPTVAEEGATVTVNGVPVNSGEASSNIPLVVGINLVSVVVTSQDTSTTKTYTLSVERSQPPMVATGVADPVSAAGATLNGTVQPNGAVRVYYQYGTDTSYGQETSRVLYSGTVEQPVAVPIGGLLELQTYHFRLVAQIGGTPFFGEDMSFTTSALPAIAITGEAQQLNVGETSVTLPGVTLTGAVDPRSLPTQVYFQYGQTELYGSRSDTVVIPGGAGLTDVNLPIGGLVEGGTYHFRIVAENADAAVVIRGQDRTFVVDEALPPATIPTDLPEVETGGFSNRTIEGATLLGEVNANGGATFVQFEYGLDTTYGQITPPVGVGNTETEAALAIPVTGLLPGTDYQYRILATNSLGTTTGANATFTTLFESPSVATGDAEEIDSTTVEVGGTVAPRGTDCDIWFDYGTAPGALTLSQQGDPGVVAGTVDSQMVTARLTGLTQGVRYYYRLRAVSADDDVPPGIGGTRSFNVAALSGLDQVYPIPVPVEERDATLTVNLTYDGGPGSGGGWRFLGDSDWNTSGESVSGLTAGTRIVEFRPIPGFAQPDSESVVILPDDNEVVMTRDYDSSVTPGSGDLKVTLKPDLAASSGRWRLLGEAGWRASGTTASGLVPGSYVIEAEPVSGLATPLPVAVRVFDGQLVEPTITYYVAEDLLGAAPQELDFEEDISVELLFPYPFSGQLRSSAGRATGSVIRPCVVATVAHVVFDDGTLSAVTDLQWFFQQHKGVHKPAPQIPRGFYLLTGYEAQREDDLGAGVPAGESTVQSQNLDVAALYFRELAGRGGYSGYLASDLEENEYLTSTEGKILVGYPIDGIAEEQQDRMHATDPVNVPLSGDDTFGQTYTTAEIRSTGGNSGGPLCVLGDTGSYYPAAVFLGGTGQTVVRAFDSDVVQLFGFAEASCGSAGEAAGTFVRDEGTQTEHPSEGVLRVNIEPQLARLVGAGWRINALDPFRGSGEEIVQSPGSFTIEFSSIPGFESPISVPVELLAGEDESITFTYAELKLPPEIISPSQLVMDIGERTVPGDEASPLRELEYQIVATNDPETFALGGALPNGVTFDPGTGATSGVPGEAGLFEVTVTVTNEGGADSAEVSLIVRPTIAPDQLAVFQRGVFGEFATSSSESGEGLVFEATGLPDGLTIDPATGVISGTPPVAGEYEALAAVTRRDATSVVQPITVWVRIPADPPVFTLQPEADRPVEYALGTTFLAEAIGAPVIRYQWYEGLSGDTSNPIQGATLPRLLTPPLFEDTNYWVRAESINGVADSETALARIIPSANPGLSAIRPSAGVLTPGFNPNRTTYGILVSNLVTEFSVAPSVLIDQTSVTFEGEVLPPVPPGSLNLAASTPVPLALGDNVFALEATAGDGSVRTYTLTVTRSNAPVPETGGTRAVTDISAVLQGTITTTLGATYFFEYGTTASGFNRRTPDRFVGGSINPIPVEATISGLAGGTQYTYRLCVVDGQPGHGSEAFFSTEPPRPRVATGNPVGVTTGSATLVGAVDPVGLDTEVFFRYRIAGSGSWIETPVQLVPGTDPIRDITSAVSGLEPLRTYQVQIMARRTVGTSSAEGTILTFVAEESAGGGDGIPDAPPVANTNPATDTEGTSAVLNAEVNPNDGSTVAFFEYGPNPGFGFTTPAVGLGNGVAFQDLSLTVENLEPGQAYYFRVVASNSVGTNNGTTLMFTTAFPDPLVTTGNALALTGGSATLFGEVDPQGAPSVPVVFAYGTDGSTFPFREAVPGGVSGTGPRIVSANIEGLTEDQTYYYRLEAGLAGFEVLGEVKLLDLATLLGAQQQPPRELEEADRQGQVRVDLLPEGIGDWRFSNEKTWRQSGELVTGLPSGVRTIEFRPVRGYITPAVTEVVVLSGQPVAVVEGQYYESAVAAELALTVQLGPEAVPGEVRWRLLGDEDTVWRESGSTLDGLGPGDYLVQTKAVPGWRTPSPREVHLAYPEGYQFGTDPAPAPQVVEIDYAPPGVPTLNPPRVVDFEESQDPELPYGFVGQIESDAGSFSGFAVRPRVVGTAAEIVFDETTFAFVEEISWAHQREKGVYEPSPQIPRGYYLFEGYEAQRQLEGTPNEFSDTSMSLNIAALYFFEDVARGGFSGFLATSDPVNEFVTSSAPKTLLGYPVVTVAPANRGKLHATPFSPTPWQQRSGQVYGLASVPGEAGFIGGPLCVLNDDGLYYPAAVFVGTGAEGRVRTLGRDFVDIVGRASVSSNGGNNQVGGGITHTSFAVVSETSQVGALFVSLVPDDRNDLKWGINPSPAERGSGTTKGNLSAGFYELVFSSVSDLVAPASQIVEVRAGQVTTIVFAYDQEADRAETWRTDNFGSPENVGEANDLADPDGDLRNNRAERAAGTDPKSGRDFFVVESFTIASGVAKAGFTAKEGRVYTLQRRSGETWVDVGESVSGPTTGETEAELTDPNPLTRGALYRIQVVFPE